jgi:hypothetical protein
MGPLQLRHECGCKQDSGCENCVGLLNKIVRVFVDDGCVYSEKVEEHVDHLGQVFKRLAANRVELKPVKCLLGADQIPLLGHEVIANLGIRPDPEKIRAMMQMAQPETVDAPHTFIGATGWVSKFLPEYAELVMPLRSIINKYKRKSKANIEHE